MATLAVTRRFDLTDAQSAHYAHSRSSLPNHGAGDRLIQRSAGSDREDLLTGVNTPMPAPSYPRLARVGRSSATAAYSAPSTWVRAAVRSGTEPGSTSETHKGSPRGADNA